MQETFIHFVWKHQYYNKGALTTTGGLAVNVLKPGNYNTDSGPDFKEAKVIIDGLEWRGSIEIHHRSSDWVAHGHTKDKAYNNVILHVVWLYDKAAERSDGTEIPTLEIANRVEPALISSYKGLINSFRPIPCADPLAGIEGVIFASMMDKMTIERLDEKASLVTDVFRSIGNDWEEAAFLLMTKNFGFKTNAEQFQRLAELVPSKLLKKHSNSITQLEALLFGQAGFLDSRPQDEYQAGLQAEYQFLKYKYDLPEPMSEFQWKFMRLRPANFPTLRMAQLASVMQHRQGLFSRIKEVKNENDLQALFGSCVSDYWYEHYRFGNEAQGKAPKMGLLSIQNIGINTVAPLLAAYGKLHDQQQYMDQAIELLQSLKSESNRITKLWNGLGIKSASSFESQGLIQLYNNYCSKKRCLSCNVGVKLLQRE
ncbi:MAG: DUF2851 family protein [Bacteroidota bacterium]